MRRTTSSVVGSLTPDASSARRQMGWPSRAPSGITSSRVPVTPRITLTRSRSSQAVAGIPGIFQGATGDQQAEQLGRVGRLDGVRRDPEFHRREIHRRDEAAPTGVGTVGRLRVAMEVVGDRPVRFGHFGDRVDPLADVGPETR